MCIDEKIAKELQDDVIIDIWAVMKGGEYPTSILVRHLDAEVNLVRFTPSASYSDPGRKQKIKGTCNPNRVAIISDDGFWNGFSLNETFNFMKSAGYDPNRVYAYYPYGYTGGDPGKSPLNYKKTFGKATEVQKIISKNLKALNKN